MKNNKGQALIEFVIILPIFLIILMYIIDYTRISYEKYKLETDMNLVIELYEDKNTQQLNEYLNEKNLKINYNTINNLTTIKLSKQTKYNMPLLNSILGTNIETSRIIYNEE